MTRKKKNKKQKPVEEIKNIRICDICNEYTECNRCIGCDCDKYICKTCNKTPCTYNIKYCSICKECFENSIKCFECDNYLCYFCEGDFTCCICNCRYCYDCKHDYRYNDSSGDIYCDDCVPQSLLDEIEEDNIMYEDFLEIQASIPFREKELKDALQKSGLELRDDSKLCKKYINNDVGEIDEIVERMCQMKFLFEYCDMRNKLDEKAKEFEEIVQAEYIPDFEIFPDTEREVLEKIGGYPDKFPWL